MLYYITKKDLLELCKNDDTGYWKNDRALDMRWDYMQKCIDIVSKLNIGQPWQILEIGSNGADIVKGSHIMDKLWRDTYKKCPKYVWDATHTPWPVKDNKYKLIIANRVFHHLIPRQKEAFLECKRCARNLIIVMPYRTKPENKSVHVIPLAKFIEWNDGIIPAVMQKTAFGYLYYWEF